MCGIVGYIGPKEKKEILLEGLQELEYRGYDSAGIAVIEGDKLHDYKAIGKLENLRVKTKAYKSEGFGISIGHTRWATHGKPTELNAHPHLGAYSYVVHNGIIENYQELKTELQNEGIKFLSQTDTETIVHLFEKYYNASNEAFSAFEKTIKRLDGAYATLLITEAAPDMIFFAKNGSPMLIGFDKDEVYFASSDTPVIGKATEVYYLEDGEYGYVRDGKVHLFDKNGSTSFTKQTLSADKILAQKDGYRFFIHSALTSAYLFERIAKVRCDIEIASEFRYKEPLLTEDTLFITISQSGETADTLEALKMAKRAGLRSLSICNVDNSSIVRESDAAILTRAGIEKGVASTKAYATQTMVIWMLDLNVGQENDTYA